MYRNSVAFKGAPVDISDGYIHFSTIEQLKETADKHFIDETAVHIAAFSATLWPKSLKWEPSRDGQLFPHLYEPLNMMQATRSWIIGKAPGTGFDVATIEKWAKNHD